MQRQRLFFKRFSLFSLIFTAGTILWGVYVRLSHSGDGCGADWPLCEGRLLPESDASQALLIEWIHRAGSGLSLLIVFSLAGFAFKIYPAKHFARKAAASAALSILLEAMIGAALVVLSLTGDNSSFLRPAVLSLHLVNSLFLIAALVFCFRAAVRQSSDKPTAVKPLVYFAAAFPLIAVFGNIASLAGGLFPASSLKEAFLMDFAPAAPGIVKLRLGHPILALVFAGLLFFAVRSPARRLKESGKASDLPPGKEKTTNPPLSSSKPPAAGGLRAPFFWLFPTSRPLFASAVLVSALLALCSGFAALVLSSMPLKLSHAAAALIFWIFLADSALQFQASETSYTGFI